MSKRKKYEYWIRSSKFTALTKFSNLFIGVLLFILLTRPLGPANFGVWGLFMAISGIVETARIGLIKNAFIRFMNRSTEGEHEALQAAAFVSSAIFSALMALAFLLLAPVMADLLKAPGLETMLRWFAATLLINTFFAQAEIYLTAKMDFRSVSYMYLARQGFLLLSVIFCLLSGLGISLTLLAILYFISVCIGSIAGLSTGGASMSWVLTDYRKWQRRLWEFGKYTFGTNMSALLFRSTDHFMASAWISTTAAAFYSASTRISNLVDMPSQVLAEVAFTRATRLNPSDTRSVKNMYEKTVGAILTFSIPALIVLLLFPALVLRLLAGNAFVQAAPILQVTAFFGFVLPFLKQYGTVMDACGFPQVNFRTNFLALILAVIFNILGIHFFGLIGAALGTATTYVIIFIITQRILYRRFGISCWQVLRYTGEFYGKLFRLARQYAAGSLSPMRA